MQSRDAASYTRYSPFFSLSLSSSLFLFLSFSLSLFLSLSLSFSLFLSLSHFTLSQVIEETPYVMTPEYLDKIMKEHRIDYVVHGNDPCIVDGKVYERGREKGREKGGYELKECVPENAATSCFLLYVSC